MSLNKYSRGHWSLSSSALPALLLAAVLCAWLSASSTSALEMRSAHVGLHDGQQSISLITRREPLQDASKSDSLDPKSDIVPSPTAFGLSLFRRAGTTCMGCCLTHPVCAQGESAHQACGTCSGAQCAGCPKSNPIPKPPHRRREPLIVSAGEAHALERRTESAMAPASLGLPLSRRAGKCDSCCTAPLACGGYSCEACSPDQCLGCPPGHPPRKRETVQVGADDASIELARKETSISTPAEFAISMFRRAGKCDACCKEPQTCGVEQGCDTCAWSQCTSCPHHYIRRQLRSPVEPAKEVSTLGKREQKGQAGTDAAPVPSDKGACEPCCATVKTCLKNGRSCVNCSVDDCKGCPPFSLSLHTRAETRSVETSVNLLPRKACNPCCATRAACMAGTGPCVECGADDCNGCPPEIPPLEKRESGVSMRIDWPLAMRSHIVSMPFDVVNKRQEDNGNNKGPPTKGNACMLCCKFLKTCKPPNCPTCDPKTCTGCPP